MTWQSFVPFTLVLCLSGCTFDVYESPDGCASDGTCPFGRGEPRNYWYQPLREAVVQPNAGPSILAHELCHGWQGRNLPDDDIGLEGWEFTPEGQAFPRLPYRWRTGQGLLEDAAWTCVAYVFKWKLDGPRFQWADKWLK